MSEIIRCKDCKPLKGDFGWNNPDVCEENFCANGVLND